MESTKPKIRVVDVAIGATAAEVETLLNAPCEDGYYASAIFNTGLPEGIGTRAFYKLRVKPERDN